MRINSTAPMPPRRDGADQILKAALLLAATVLTIMVLLFVWQQVLDFGRQINQGMEAREQRSLDVMSSRAWAGNDP